MAAEAHLVDPDISFIRQTVGAGGDSLKKCYQCATCSVVCNLSPEENPFPRKEMIWAQWGLKERLVKDPDIWLCYQCNDCSTYCPRGAKPGEVLAALRNLAVRHYSVPKFLATIVNEPRYIAVAFALPVFLLLVILAAIGRLTIPQGPIVYAKFFPHWVVDPLYILAALFAVWVSVSGIIRFWSDLSGKESGSGDPSSEKPSILGFSFSNILPAIVDVLLHRKFNDCETNKNRFYAHLPIFYGFVALLITTALVSIYTYVFGKESPIPLSNFIKWIGNFGALILLVGIVLAIYNRLTQEEEGRKGTYLDWVLLWVVFGVAVSGILAEVFRLADIATLAYPVYFIHLVFVLYLFAYMPFTKFAHLIYRTTALVHAKYTGRKIKGLPPKMAYLPPETSDKGVEGAHEKNL